MGNNKGYKPKKHLIKMANEEDYKKLLDKVEKVTKEKKIDLSSDEDLSIAIMNLIGIEEHLFFTAEKTGKQNIYYDLLNEVREMRKDLLKKIIKEYEGEVWCISKHLLSASMRLMEVGTKQLNAGKKEEAKELFKKAFNLYSLFWALNLKMVDSKLIKDKGIVNEGDIKKAFNEDAGNYKELKVNSSQDSKEESKEDKTFFSKLGDIVKKAIDCCKE